MIKEKIIGRNVSILYRSENRYIDKMLEEYRVSKTQVEILLYINDFPQINLKEINDFFRFNKATITKNIKHLIHEGYVSSSSSKSDRREKILTLTDKSEDVLSTAKQYFDRWESIVLKGIPIEEIEVSRNVLAKMVENMSRIGEDQ